MADITLLSRLINGVVRNVDLSSNTLIVDSLKVGSISPAELTKTILQNLINLQNGTDFSSATNSHSHNGMYFTEPELTSTTNGSAGASLIGIDQTPAFTNFTPGAGNVQAALEAIDTALGTAAGNEFVDNVFRVKDNGDATKKIAFEASGIATATTRTITMPDANVDLGNLTNSNINASAAIAYSKLALSGSIVNADVNASAAIAYSKLALSGSIVNADINASAAIAYSKLATLSIDRALVSDGSGFISPSSVTATELGYVSGVTSAIQTQLNARALDSAVIKKDGSVAFTAAQSMGGFKLTSLGAPTAASDAATKGYVDNALEGLKPKSAVRVASTANVVIASALEAGDAIDGITLVAGDRVLLKNQSAAAENGIYIAVASGAASRSTDFDSLSPVDEINKSIVAVQEGTANAGKIFVQYGTVATLETDPINFTFFNSISGLTGGDGITVSGSNISVDHDGQGFDFVTGQLVLELDGGSLSKSASGLKVAAGGITNTEVNASAAIAYSKLALSGSIVNADVNASAAIAYSKLALSGSIVNADINASAAIAYSKLALSGSIVDADINASAAIAYSKLNLSASIVNADINSGAAIADSKLATISTANKVSGSAVQLNSNGSISNSTGLKVDHAPLVKKPLVAGESFVANVSFLVRFAISGETASRCYKADKDTSVSDKFYAVGVALSTGAVSAGGNIDVIMVGSHTLGSSDSAFGAGDVGKAVYLTSAGAFSITPPSATNEAVYRIGVVEDTNKIWVGGVQLNGIN